MLTDGVRRYHVLYEEQAKPLLYTAPWWLDVTCGKNAWDVLLMREPVSNIEAGLAYFPTRIRGLKTIITPPATQWVQLISNQPEEFSFDQPVAEYFPSCRILDVSIKSPSKWILGGNGYGVTTRYSYVLPYLDRVEKMKAGYNEGLRRNLKQAEKIFEIKESDDVGTFISLCKSTFTQRSSKAPWWMDDILPAVIDELIKRECGRLSFVFLDGKVIAAMLTGWDQCTDYYLAGGRDATAEGISAHGLLLDQAVTSAQDRGNAFDFEGSMVPGIANFFQSFGAHPIPYIQVRKFRGLGLLWSLMQ
jgi:hypothetical protein